MGELAEVVVVGSACCVLVVAKERVRVGSDGKRKGGGNRVTGVRSSSTERRSERLIMKVLFRP